MTDPPENVLINVPSDKLTLVEGGNGPRLVCEASGEPQVRYKWFFASPDLIETGLNISNLDGPSMVTFQAKRSIRSQSFRLQKQTRQSGTLNPSDYELSDINQRSNRETEATQLGAKIGNNRGGNGNVGRDRSLIELTDSATLSEQVNGNTISILDLSNTNVDRKQTGHYICEASNRLGQRRQSVYVNVQCKYNLTKQFFLT